MKKLLNIYKPLGLTPLQLINNLRQQHSEYANEKISYAGRLDPMAHGVMLLMIGEATKYREQTLSLPKAYRFDLLLGLQTDTYDLLGYLKTVDAKQLPSNDNLIVNSFVKNHSGTQLQSYPPYSSKTVQGKPLFWWAKNDKLTEIEIPKRDIEIFEFNLLSKGKILSKELEQKVQTALETVTGDFRQNEIQKKWDVFFAKNTQQSFSTLKCSIVCSSGTYVRGLVNDLGESLGCGAVTLDILRTKVGEHTLSETIKLQ